jgi:hypothetical protein
MSFWHDVSAHLRSEVGIQPALRSCAGVHQVRFACRQALPAVNERGSDLPRALCRARVTEELQRLRGTRIAEHLRLVLSTIDRQ